MGVVSSNFCCLLPEVVLFVLFERAREHTQEGAVNVKITKSHHKRRVLLEMRCVAFQMPRQECVTLVSSDLVLLSHARGGGGRDIYGET
jgi:hypothetical protein